MLKARGQLGDSCSDRPSPRRPCRPCFGGFARPAGAAMRHGPHHAAQKSARPEPSRRERSHRTQRYRRSTAHRRAAARTCTYRSGQCRPGASRERDFLCRRLLQVMTMDFSLFAFALRCSPGRDAALAIFRRGRVLLIDANRPAQASLERGTRISGGKRRAKGEERPHFRYTTPPFITKLTLVTALMSFVGSAGYGDEVGEVSRFELRRFDPPSPAAWRRSADRPATPRPGVIPYCTIVRIRVPGCHAGRGRHRIRPPSARRPQSAS